MKNILKRSNSKESSPINYSRRELMVRSALGFGSLPLKSLITGLPVPFLLGLAQGSNLAHAMSNSSKKYFIISHKGGGDPVNISCPGTYANPNRANDPRSSVGHPDVDGFKTPTTFRLGRKSVRAAEPWSTLDEDLRANMGFWHHGTYTNAHPDFASVRRFNGAIKGPDGNGSAEISALIAEETSKDLAPVVPEPLSLGGDRVQFGGRFLPTLQPLDVKGLFSGGVKNLDAMVALRDNFIDSAYYTVKKNGTPAQRKFLDEYAKSRQEASTVSDGLGALITGIDGNDSKNQAVLAVALLQLNVCPVVTLGLNFGGDTHTGSDDEVRETTSEMAVLNTLWKELKGANLEDRTIVTSLNVFGRGMVRNSADGTNHNGSHHAMFTIGTNIAPGIIGGVEPVRKNNKITNFQATGINSGTGNAGNADIPFSETLVSVGKTLAKAVGIDDSIIDKRFDGGKIISAALNS